MQVVNGAGTGANANRGKWERFAALAACACGTAWLYRRVVRLVPRTSSAEPTGTGEVIHWVRGMDHDALEQIQRWTHGMGHAWAFFACCIALFAIYAIVLWLAKRVGGGERWFVALAVAAPLFFMGRLICAPAMLSSDVYAYSHYGQLLGVQHIDAHGPKATEHSEKDKDDPFSLDGYYDFVPSVYGPLWTVMSAGIVLAAHGHIGLTVLMFRALEVACALGSAGLIWLILRRRLPDEALRGVLMFLWNPLVLVETALSGHNDMCMMLLALIAVWLHLRGWRAAAVFALALSALVKVITWPLVPLYGLMLLRTIPAWKDRASLVLRAGASIGAAVCLSILAARMNPHEFFARTASSAEFYENNFHEPLFKLLRYCMGESRDTLDAPMPFRSYWLETTDHVNLQSEPDNHSEDLARIPDKTPLLALSDEDSDEWMRAYFPAKHLQGYVPWKRLTVIDDPPGADSDPATSRMSGWPPEWPTVIRANWWIRTVTWGLLALFGLTAAWRADNFEHYLRWAAWFFIASLLLVFTKVWPWYAIWPVAYGALNPRSGAARMAMLLSAGMLTLYTYLEYSGPWFDYRSLPTIVLPVLVFAIWGLIDKVRGRSTRAVA